MTSRVRTRLSDSGRWGISGSLDPVGAVVQDAVGDGVGTCQSKPCYFKGRLVLEMHLLLTCLQKMVN